MWTECKRERVRGHIKTRQRQILQRETNNGTSCDLYRIEDIEYCMGMLHDKFIFSVGYE